MTGVVYLVRHCAAAQKGAGPQADAPLTPAGAAAAVALAGFLAAQQGPPIRSLVSSPYRRALDTAAPLAALLGLTVEPDARLSEQVLGDPVSADWRAWRAPAWATADVLYPAGEAGRTALGAALAAVADLAAFARGGARATEPLAAVAVSHGNLLAWLLLQLDPRVGFAEGLRPTTPDVYRLAVADGDVDVRRIWHEP